MIVKDIQINNKKANKTENIKLAIVSNPSKLATRTTKFGIKVANKNKHSGMIQTKEYLTDNFLSFISFININIINNVNKMITNINFFDIIYTS